LKIERVRTFIQNFDDNLQGGIPKSLVVLLSGTPGTMKSSLAYSILYHNALEKGIRSVYMTLEQSRESLLQQMDSDGNGRSEGPGDYELLVVDSLDVLEMAAHDGGQPPHRTILPVRVAS